MIVETYTFESEQWLPRPLEDVFAFFADASNLEALTPPWLHFRIITPSPIEMRLGTVIDYRLRLHGLPLNWQSEITVWDPPHRFVDEQRRGPYGLWVHTHLFFEKDGGTVVQDHVVYAVPGGRLVHKILVSRDLERIFDYRRRRLHELYASPGIPPDTIDP